MYLTYKWEVEKNQWQKREDQRRDAALDRSQADAASSAIILTVNRSASRPRERIAGRSRRRFGAPDWERVSLLLTLALWACLIINWQAAGATTGPVLRADYQFQNTLNSPLPAAPPLVSLGNDTFGPSTVDGLATTVLNFPKDDGLLLGSSGGVVPNANYSVAVLFRFNEVSGWRRILDFKNRSSDDGLYTYNGALNFYPVVIGSSAPISSNVFVQVVLTRDLSQNVVGYVDGVQQIVFVDTNGLAITDSGNPLIFFRDDLVYTNEASSGSVARIRLYDGALTPSQVAALDRLPGEPVVTNTIQADLQVTKSADHYTVDLGNVVTFTIVVSNRGPDSVSNVLVPEHLSPGWVFLGATNGPYASFDLVNTQWTLFTLPAYASEVLLLQAQAIAPGWLSNSVEVLPPQGVLDPNPANNTSALAVMAAQPQADLKLTKVAGTNFTEVTNGVTFDVTVENLGPDAAKNITVKEQLPRDWYITDAKAPDGSSWDPSSRTWTITNLAVSAKSTLKVTVLPMRGGKYTNTAVITASQPADPNPDNNQASASVEFVGYSACGMASVCTVGGAPNANATVTLIPPKTMLTTATLTTTTDARGLFCLTNLLAGTYTLQVTPADPASGISPYEQPVDIGPDTGSVNPWSRWPMITGVVTFGPGGPPYPKVTVTVTDGTVQKTATTDQNGMYTVTGLADKQYTVTAKPPVAGLSSFPASSNVLVGPGGASCPARADFQLIGALKIEGRLTTCQGTAVIPYATVSLSIDGFANLRTYNVGTDGRYSFTNLPPGAYTLTPSHPTFTFAPASKNVTLAKNNAVVNFGGTANNGVIGGRLFSRNRAPLANVTVNLVDLSSGRNVNTTTAADGTFIFNNVQAGAYSVVPVSPQQGFVFTPPFAPGVVGGANPTCNNYVLFVGNLNAVELVSLEVVQVVQDWQNNVPLVQGKPTLVRAFLKPAGTNTQPVRVNNATLLIQSGTTTKTLRPRADIDARADYAKRRNDPKTSLAFDIPTALTKGQVTFTLQWPGGVLTTYLDTAGQQTAVRNNSTTVQFAPTPELPLKWVLVSWKFGETTTAANNALVTTQQKRLVAGLPTISIPSGNGTLTSLDWSPPKDPKKGATKDEIEELRNHLQAKLARKRELDEFNPNKSKTIYHGVLSGTAITGQAGGIPAKTSFADMSQEPAGGDKNLPTHELGHAIGRQHDVHSAFGITVKAGWQLKTGRCTETAAGTAPDYPMDQHDTDALAPTLGPMQLGDYRYGYGWDSSDNSYISPFGTADIMSYCQWTTPWVWPGIPSYTNLFSSLNSRFGPAVVPQVLTKEDATIPILLISGEIEMTADTLTLDPILQVLRTESATLPDPGPYTLLLLDGASNVLEQVPFMPTVPVIEENESDTLLYAYFTLEIPQIAGLSAVQILDQSRVLTNRTVSPHQPAVQIISPSSGAVLTNDPVSVVWSGFHPDGLPLSYVLQYSAHGGTNWETLALDLATNQFSVASALLRGSTDASFRVIVSDGFNQSSVLIGPVSVPDHSPQVGIIEPASGDVFAGQAPVVLRATAWDVEDGELAPSQLRWSDSVSGDLGSGDEVSVDASQLSEGEHVFQVTATDSAGNQTTSNVVVSIQRLMNVPLTVQVMGDQIQLSWPSSASTLGVWAAFSVDSPTWFLLEGQPIESGDSLLLNVPILEDAMFFRLADP